MNIAKITERALKMRNPQLQLSVTSNNTLLNTSNYMTIVRQRRIPILRRFKWWIGGCLLLAANILGAYNDDSYG